MLIFCVLIILKPSLRSGIASKNPPSLGQYDLLPSYGYVFPKTLPFRGSCYYLFFFKLLIFIFKKNVINLYSHFKSTIKEI